MCMEAGKLDTLAALAIVATVTFECCTTHVFCFTNKFAMMVMMVLMMLGTLSEHM